MPALPARPNLEHLRNQAKQLLRAAKSGDDAAVREIRRWSERITLASAQLAVARGYGYASWSLLKTEVDARTRTLSNQAIAFCQVSVGRIRLAMRMLEAIPEIGELSFSTAVVLGNAALVGEALRRDPGLAQRTDPDLGWSPLHLACASRWCQVSTAHAEGLVAVGRLLLDCGAEVTALGTGARAGWSPLRCVVATANTGPSNRALAALLLERGAVPNDHDLYLAGFAHDRRLLLPLLLDNMAHAGEVMEQALAAPISNNDAATARLLLEAGADPHRYRDDDGNHIPIVWAALRAGCDETLVGLLLAHRADPNAVGSDGYSPYRLATAAGNDALRELLRQYGADVRLTAGDRLLYACRREDRTDALHVLDSNPQLMATLTDDERGAVVRAAERGEVGAVTLMLDVGFPINSRGENGATALHAAAYSGGAAMVRALIERGADIEARDASWNSTPLGWAIVGSGFHASLNPTPDWVATVSTLLDHGASAEGITLHPDDEKPPSPEVAALLRAHLDRA